MIGSIGLVLFEYLHFSELQKLCCVSTKLRGPKEISDEHIRISGYLHDRQILFLLQEKGSDATEYQEEYKDIIHPNSPDFASSRIMIGVHPIEPPINVGNRLLLGWRRWLVMKYTNEGDNGMQFATMGWDRLVHYFVPNTICDIIDESDDRPMMVGLRETAKRRKIYMGYKCSAKYGCENTRLTHRMFWSNGENDVLCGECMDSPGMEIAKMQYMWENSYDYEDWWFSEHHYFEEGEHYERVGRFPNEKEAWGLEDDEKWTTLFKLDSIMVPVEHGTVDYIMYAEVRWITKGTRNI